MPEVPQAEDVELIFWNSIKDSRDILQLEAYLTSFPDGRFVEIARDTIAVLQQQELAALSVPSIEPEPETALEPEFQVLEIEDTLFALENAPVRFAPDAGEALVAHLTPGTEVEVTGRVGGTDWLRIVLQDRSEAFVQQSGLGTRREYEDRIRQSQQALLPANTPVAAVNTTTNEEEHLGPPLIIPETAIPGVVVKPVTPDPEPAHQQVVSEEEETQLALGVFPEVKERPVGEVFRDCDECPEMIVVPRGSYQMGDLTGRGPNDERPVRTVKIDYFLSVSRFEVTKEEYKAFISDSGHRSDGPCSVWSGAKLVPQPGKNWQEPGFAQDGSHPATCISFEDAKAYTLWLSRKTGENYRLLSESEWEYVARAGTDTLFWFGSRIGYDQANFDETNWATMPVGHYTPNAFGLHDVLGNVWEWTEDCWNASYLGAPTDGSAVTKGRCQRRMLRGGSWASAPGLLRSSNRTGESVATRTALNGMRVAKASFTP